MLPRLVMSSPWPDWPNHALTKPNCIWTIALGPVQCCERVVKQLLVPDSVDVFIGAQDGPALTRSGGKPEAPPWKMRPARAARLGMMSAPAAVARRIVRRVSRI